MSETRIPHTFEARLDTKCNRSGRSPLSDLSESGDAFGVSGNMWVTDTLLEKRRGIGRIGDTVWSLV